MTRFALSAAVAVLVCAVAVAAPPKSGPQVGEPVPGPFHPLNLTGSAAGEKDCLYCRFSGQPVAVVFARQQTPAVTKLVKAIDSAIEKNQGKKFNSFVTYLSDNTAINDQAKEMAKAEGVKHVVLSSMGSEGPEEYNVAKDAEVTVILYSGNKVKANHSYAAGEMCEKCVETVVADLSKITTK